MGHIQKMSILPKLAGTARAAQLVHELRGLPSKAKELKIGVFAQMMHFEQWASIHDCIYNSMHGAARVGNVVIDVFFTVNFAHTEAAHPFLPVLEAEAPKELRLMLYSADEVAGTTVDNHMFLQQLAVVGEMSLEYDLIIKAHTMDDMPWRETMMKASTGCVCGSVDGVQAIIEEFLRNENLGMAGPESFTGLNDGSGIKNAEFGHLFKGFNQTAVEEMKSLWSLTEQPLPPQTHWAFVAGSMYWTRGALLLQNKAFMQHIPAILVNCDPQLGCGFLGGFELLIPTLITATHKITR